MISTYDNGLTLHDIVLDSFEPIVVKNSLNSFAINSLSATLLPLMQKLSFQTVLLIPLPMIVFKIFQDCDKSLLLSSSCLL